MNSVRLIAVYYRFNGRVRKSTFPEANKANNPAVFHVTGHGFVSTLSLARHCRRLYFKPRRFSNSRGDVTAKRRNDGNGQTLICLAKQRSFIFAQRVSSLHLDESKHINVVVVLTLSTIHDKLTASRGFGNAAIRRRK